MPDLDRFEDIAGAHLDADAQKRLKCCRKNLLATQAERTGNDAEPPLVLAYAEYGGDSPSMPEAETHHCKRTSCDVLLQCFTHAKDRRRRCRAHLSGRSQVVNYLLEAAAAITDALEPFKIAFQPLAGGVLAGELQDCSFPRSFEPAEDQHDRSHGWVRALLTPSRRINWTKAGQSGSAADLWTYCSGGKLIRHTVQLIEQLLRTSARTGRGQPGAGGQVGRGRQGAKWRAVAAKLEAQMNQGKPYPGMNVTAGIHDVNPWVVRRALESSPRLQQWASQKAGHAPRCDALDVAPTGSGVPAEIYADTSSDPAVLAELADEQRVWEKLLRTDKKLRALMQKAENEPDKQAYYRDVRNRDRVVALANEMASDDGD